MIEIKGFLYVSGLLELEKSERWNEAVELLIDIWNNDKTNPAKLCRVLAECWYVLTAWEICIRTEGLSFSDLKKTLIDTTQYGLLYFNRDVNFLWAAGYMISLFPYLFYDEDSDANYLEWEHRGKSMMQLSNELDSNNLIARALYLGTRKNDAEYYEAKRELNKLLSEIFDGKTAIEEYFKEILSV